MKINLKELATFAMLSATMLISKLVLEAIPNFHLLAVFTIAMTAVYRQKALYPIYGYVFLQGLVAGFQPWWILHLYVWAVLWVVVMLLPKNMGKVTATVVYTAVCTLHGLFFGILSAISQALLFGMGFIEMVITGIPYDLIHAGHNLILGAVLIMPITMVLRGTQKYLKN
ncbi:MAG: hypothetical protein J6Q74_00310 [Clostridia bacterium]|nr:hypothetical protein [Clostridia bacterium]